MHLNKALILTLVSLYALLTACTTYPTFGFPVEQGNIQAGRQAFTDQGCHLCHSVAGIRLPPSEGALSNVLELGGEVSEVAAYSELVSSIINPDHSISERAADALRRRGLDPEDSPMPMGRVDSMTVRQLIDIVAFLDSRYVLIDAYDRTE